MNMKIFRYFISLALFCISLSSCTLFDLDFQSNEEYEAKKADNKVNMTIWEFIQSRPDIFSSLIEGIQYAGIEDLYKEAGNTHILLTNSALSSGDNCFWKKMPTHYPETRNREVLHPPLLFSNQEFVLQRDYGQNEHFEDRKSVV